MVEVDNDICIQCGACMEVCPVLALINIGDYIIVMPWCINCGACICVCPVEAIHFVAE